MERERYSARDREREKRYIYIEREIDRELG